MYASIVATALLMNFAETGGNAVEADGLYRIERQVIQRTNAERTRRGLPTLETDMNLVRSARNHAAWMTRTRTLRHAHSAAAENIAMGQNSSEEAVRSWMSSSGHRANILSRGHSRIGVAAFTTPGGTIYWCQQFE